MLCGPALEADRLFITGIHLTISSKVELPLLPPCVQVEHTVEVLQAGGEAAAIGGAICSKAQQLHARLLVLAPHRKGAIKRILVGSVTDYCLSKAPCQVLIVKSQHVEP